MWSQVCSSLAAHYVLRGWAVHSRQDISGGFHPIYIPSWSWAWKLSLLYVYFQNPTIWFHFLCFPMSRNRLGRQNVTGWPAMQSTMIRWNTNLLTNADWWPQLFRNTFSLLSLLSGNFLFPFSIFYHVIKPPKPQKGKKLAWMLSACDTMEHKSGTLNNANRWPQLFEILFPGFPHHCLWNKIKCLRNFGLRCCSTYRVAISYPAWALNSGQQISANFALIYIPSWFSA